MDKNNIKKLLDRYFEGETSLQEEQTLKVYFTSNSIDPELEEFKHLFAFFVQEQQLKTRNDFTIHPIQKAKPIIRVQMWRWAAAAVFILSISSWYFIGNPWDNKPVAQQIDWSKYEPKTEKQAIQLTFNALKKTSSAIKKSTRAVGKEVKIMKRLVDFD